MKRSPSHANGSSLPQSSSDETQSVESQAPVGHRTPQRDVSLKRSHEGTAQASRKQAKRVTKRALSGSKELQGDKRDKFTSQEKPSNPEQRTNTGSSKNKTFVEEDSKEDPKGTSTNEAHPPFSETIAADHENTDASNTPKNSQEASKQSPALLVPTGRVDTMKSLEFYAGLALCPCIRNPELRAAFCRLLLRLLMNSHPVDMHAIILYQRNAKVYKPFDYLMRVMGTLSESVFATDTDEKFEFVQNVNAGVGALLRSFQESPVDRMYHMFAFIPREVSARDLERLRATLVDVAQGLPVSCKDGSSRIFYGIITFIGLSVDKDVACMLEALVNELSDNNCFTFTNLPYANHEYDSSSLFQLCRRKERPASGSLMWASIIALQASGKLAVAYDWITKTLSS